MNFDRIEVASPFPGPIYRVAETESTMRDARLLAARGDADGAGVLAGYQRGGRGRVEGRKWSARPGESVLCTLLLRRPPAQGFTLRVGLAAAETVEAFLPSGARAEVKWPNDVLVGGRKLCGILCEGDGSVIYVGIGINVSQASFPAELADTATSIARELAATSESVPTYEIPTVETVLSEFLFRLDATLSRPNWREAVTARLWGLGSTVRFRPGDPAREEIIEGRVGGLGDTGELILADARMADGSVRAEYRAYSGELPVGRG